MGWGRRDRPGTAARPAGRRWGKLGVRERDVEREREGSRRNESAAMSARPLLRPAPRSAMFFPLAVLVAVLPGLYALNSWDLTPPGPWWGLRGLAVLEGQALDQWEAPGVTPALEAWAYRSVASQPPLYAWLEAVGLALSPDRDPLATVLPSYAAGALVVVLVYFHGRLWSGPGLGLVAAVLTGFNRDLLIQMQQATPTTLALAGALGALLCHATHLRRFGGASPAGRWGWGGPVFLAVLGGLSLGVSLMSVGLFGLMVVPVVLLHEAYRAAGASATPRDRPGPGHGGVAGGPLTGGTGLAAWLRRRLIGIAASPSLIGGAIVLLVALAVAAPWHAAMIRAHGYEALGALLAPFGASNRSRPGLLAWMIRLAPATLPLGIFAAFRATRRALADDTDEPGTVGGAFWVLWLGTAALFPAVWPGGPRPLGILFLLVPLNLLAAQAISDLALRRIPARALTWLAPATAVTVAWWASANLSGALNELFHGRAGTDTALGLHLALDVIVVSVWLTRRLDRWARRRDDRRRGVLAGFLVAVLVVTVAGGSREVWFRHRETEDLLMLRTMILRRDRERPFTQVAVVGPEIFRQAGDADMPVPGGRLRFILRTALPRLPQLDLAGTDDLLKLPAGPPGGQRLVVLAGRNQRLPHAVQSRLKLEAIHPGRHGVLDAFATAHDEPARRGPAPAPPPSPPTVENGR